MFRKIKTKFRGVYLVKLDQFKDHRGFFTKIFSHSFFKKIINNEIREINYSFTKKKGTIRGFHYQTKPYEETKIIKCIEGKIIDISIDLRKKSKTYLKLFKTELYHNDNTCLVLPEGFAHGFQALTDNCRLIYLHTQIFNKNKYRVISPLDKKLEIEWPIKRYILSKQDRHAKKL